MRRFAHGGLANAAGDADDLRAHLTAPSTTCFLQCEQRVGDDKHR